MFFRRAVAVHRRLRRPGPHDPSAFAAGGTNDDSDAGLIALLEERAQIGCRPIYELPEDGPGHRWDPERRSGGPVVRLRDAGSAARNEDSMAGGARQFPPPLELAFSWRATASTEVRS